MDAHRIIKEHGELLARCQAIAEGEPFKAKLSDAHDDIFAIEIDGGEITLSWVEYESGYYDDPGSCCTNVAKFPAALLPMTDQALAAWRVEYRAEQARLLKKMAEQKRLDDEAAGLKAAAEREKRDRREFARLKAKYG